MTPPRWTLWLGAVALLVALGGRGMRKLARNGWDLHGLSRETARAAEEGREFEARLERLKKDDAYLEKVARRELGLMKAGEIEYRFEPSR